MLGVNRIFIHSERAAWAETLTKIAATHAPDDAYGEAREQFSEKELADLSISIAMINAWNRLHRRARGAPVRFRGGGLSPASASTSGPARLFVPYAAAAGAAALLFDR
jgi:hypothetical protein